MVLLKSCGKITAAAVTGPAKQPRPASSVPHSKIHLDKKVITCRKIRFSNVINSRKSY